MVVIPAHNEAARLPESLRALSTAALALPVPTLTVVVLDACDDGSAALAGRFGADVHFVEVDAGNVGAARAAGFTYARSVCEAIDLERTWYATSDADSVVPADWLQRMTAAEADMVLGVVRVPDWRNHPAEVVRRYLRAYHATVTGRGHDHVHGANMGFNAASYWKVGGFRALATGEDVELVERFEAAGMVIRRDATSTVVTSDRRDARAPGGFAAHLRGLARSPRPPQTGEPA